MSQRDKKEKPKATCSFTEFVYLVSHSDQLPALQKLQVIREVYEREEKHILTVLEEDGKNQKTCCSKCCRAFCYCLKRPFKGIKFQFSMNYPKERINLVHCLLWLTIGLDATAVQQIIYGIYARYGPPFFSWYQNAWCCRRKWSRFVKRHPHKHTDQVRRIALLAPLSVLSQSNKNSEDEEELSTNENKLDGERENDTFQFPTGSIGVGHRLSHPISMKGIKNCVVEILPVPLSTPLGSLNYSYIIIDLPTGEVALIDPAVPDKVLDVLHHLQKQHLQETKGERQLYVSTILTTHRHHDHAGGNEKIVKKLPNSKTIRVVGGKGENIYKVNKTCKDGEYIYLGSSTRFRCIETPGHTKHHMAFHLTYKEKNSAKWTWEDPFEKENVPSDKANRRRNDAISIPMKARIPSYSNDLFRNDDARVGLFVSDTKAAIEETTIVIEEEREREKDSASSNTSSQFLEGSDKKEKKFTGVGVDFVHTSGVIFTGDHLFVGGMGAIFESSIKEWWKGAKRIMKLPKNTLVCVGHEYTETFAPFGAWLEPNYAPAQDQLDFIIRRRFGHRLSLTTIPSSVGREMATNCYLRLEDQTFRRRLGIGRDVNIEDAMKIVRKTSLATSSLWSLPGSNSIVEAEPDLVSNTSNCTTETLNEEEEGEFDK
eukprot:g5942.t1